MPPFSDLAKLANEVNGMYRFMIGIIQSIDGWQLTRKGVASPESVVQ